MRHYFGKKGQGEGMSLLVKVGIFVAALVVLAIVGYLWGKGALDGIKRLFSGI